MTIPEPYFQSVPGCGDLFMEEIIVDYVYPLLSVLKDKDGNRYLCSCFDTRGCQQWILTSITTDSLIKMLRDQITLADPFEDPVSQKIMGIRDYATADEAFRLVNSDENLKYCIPTQGIYMDSEPGEWDEYISRILTGA